MVDASINKLAEKASKKTSASSLALNNLRGIVILIVVAFHSVSAYLGSLAPAAYPFDKPPYLWRAFPIVDAHRWFGFDIFCAWQDVCLMCLMFFLSALFAWPSLERKGTWGFLNNRLLRLGVPCLFGLTIMMPIALYPVYRVTATDPSVAAYLRHLLALPFWPNGPMWFLWQLLALTFVAAALHAFAPGFVEFLAKHSASAAERPFRYFVFLAIAAALAYVPMALAFTPMRWANTGFFAVQFCRPLLYTTVYIAGLAMGARGLGQGLLADGGMLAPRWTRWVAGALLAFMLWIGLAALSMSAKNYGPLALQIGADLAFALACISGCFAAFAVTLRFGTSPSRILGSASENAFGIYVLHYPFVIWLQYALLGSALFAVAKGSLVFAGSLLCSWALAIAFRSVPFASALVGGERRAFSRAPARLVTPFDGDDHPDIRLTHIAR